MERVKCLDCVHFQCNEEEVSCVFEEKCCLLNPEDCTAPEDRPCFKKNFNIDQISDVEWDKILEAHKTVDWKDLDKKEAFLSFIETYIKDNKRVLSDSFAYFSSECIFEPDVFEQYCFELYNFIENYAKKCFIKPICSETYFYNEYHGFILNNIYYKISLVHGQGSFVSIEKVEKSANTKNFMRYEDILSDKKIDIKNNVKALMIESLNKIASEFTEDGVSEDMIKEILKEIANNED